MAASLSSLQELSPSSRSDQVQGMTRIQLQALAKTCGVKVLTAGCKMQVACAC